MDPKPDTIKISATQREEVQATFADIFVAIKGASLVSGDAALKKAREVSQLVDELTRFGLPAEAIHLQSVTTFERVEWKYPDEAAQTIALEKALVKATDKARNIAEKLGVKLLGVYNLVESVRDFEAPAPQMQFAAQAKEASRSISPPADLGLEIQHSKAIEIRIEVEYRISAFEQE